MKLRIKTFYLLLAVFLLFGFISCSNLFQKTNTNTNEIGYISLGNTTCARSSVVPESDEVLLSKLTNVTLQCVWGSDTDNPVTTNITGSTWTEFIAQFASPGYPLQTGTYSFTLIATLKQDISLSGVSFQAIKNDSIEAGTTKTLNFTLSPTTATTGGIDITWNITQGDPELVEFSLKKLSDGSISSSSDDDLSSGTTRFFKDNLAPGEYELTANFLGFENDYDDPELPVLNTWKGRVRVVAGIITTKTIDWAIEAVYTISWNLNSGTISDATYVQHERYTRKSNTITLPAASNMSRAGYNFLGWYDNASFTGNPITSIPSNSAGNKSLNAKWELATYTITYHCLGVTTNKTSYTINDSSFTLTAPSGSDGQNTAESYYFNGWYTSEYYGASDLITEINPATTLEDLDIYAAQSNNIHVASSTSTPYAGSADNNGLFSSSPVDSIATAISKIVTYNTPIGWIIVIDDNLTGTQIINNSSLTTSKLASSTPLQISGAGTTAKVLNGGSLSEGNNRTTLTINTAVPVSITNLEITGGRGTVDSDKYYGGGLYLAANSQVDLGNGVKIYGNTCDFGGGVYVAAGATLCMHGTAIIGDTEKTYISSITTDTDFNSISTSVSGDYSDWKCANYAVGYDSGISVHDPGGGGIYNLGTVALGYSSYTDEEHNNVSSLTGGIYNNASNRAGGIFGFNSDNNIIVASGNIMYNASIGSSGWGAGILEKEGKLTLIDGKINNNYSISYAGGVYLGASDYSNPSYFYMKGGEIKDNHSWHTGTAVYTDRGAMIMTGGTISGNKTHYTDSDSTGGVYVFGRASITGGTIEDNLKNDGTTSSAIYAGNADWTLGGSANIPYGGTGEANAIKIYKVVTVSSPVTNNLTLIYYRMEPNSDGSSVILQGGDSSDYSKFSLKNNPGTTWTNQYTINSSGYAIPN